MSLPQKFRKADLKPGEVLCSYCTGRCCRYFALPIEKPDTREELDYIRWYMFHGKVCVFVEEGTWYLLVYADCKHLMPDYRCGNYEDRPAICRSYSTDNCEFDDDAVYDMFFETPEQLWEYANAVMPAKKLRKFSSAPAVAREVQLPVIA